VTNEEEEHGGVSPGSYVRGMPTFALTLVHGPNWDNAHPIRSQDAWSEHAAFMDALVAEGLIVVGGPLDEGDRTLHLVDAADEAHIRTRLSEDPWAAMGLLEIGSIQRWQLWLDGRPGRNR
jgi:uncharacterized protein YciI